jgi:predicted RNase H-like HicB family nuclease
MNPKDKYVKLVEWSDEDGCYIGSCPELFYGGCHGDDPRQVFDELCRIVEETIESYVRDGKPLPRPMSGKQFVNAMQSVA